MDRMAGLAIENETLHALLADAATVLLHFADTHDSDLAAECLVRISEGRPATGSARHMRRSPGDLA